VTTIEIEDRDNDTDVVGNSVANVNYFYEYLRSLGNADAYGFAEFLKRFMRNIMYGLEGNSVAERITIGKTYHKRLNSATWDFIRER
jgi:hypothetical protein